jgi:hypothetical protein
MTCPDSSTSMNKPVERVYSFSFTDCPSSVIFRFCDGTALIGIVSIID